MDKGSPSFLKIVYFDEAAAQDYLDITNGGRLDWSKEENKQRAAQILTEIEAQAKGSFNIISFLKGSVSGNLDAKASGEIAKLFDKTIKNTLLTDYIAKAYNDDKIKKFDDSGVYAPVNSVTLYKMYSSYLSIVPKDQLPFDIEKLNDAVLGERGYYAMLLKKEDTPSSVLRFNINAFKNSYSLADLSKMDLTYYGVKVGMCKQTELGIDKEFEFQNKPAEVTAESILDEETPKQEIELAVYDIVLAGEGMKQIVMFYGSDRAFTDIIPKSHRNLLSVAMQVDDESKKLVMEVRGFPKQKSDSEKLKKKKPMVRNLVIFANEYNSVNEHVITNFIDFMAQLSISNMYIQNPPALLRDQVERVYGDKGIIKTEHQKYNVISEDIIRQIYTGFDRRIIGQKAVKKKLLKALYPIVDNKQNKPVVILFYGDSGLGKTETVQYVTELLGGALLRKQFSMYQNNEFSNYLFGGKHNQKSFAKDLLARDSNVILLDEFDKANSVFHSAFYQLFDEGIFEDQNYKVDVRHAAIFCTSNYHTTDEIKEKLGLPIYNRFDAIIEFDQLAGDAKMKIAEMTLRTMDKSTLLPIDIRKKIISASLTMSNAREIQRLVKDTISLCEINRICNGIKAENGTE